MSVKWILLAFALVAGSGGGLFYVGTLNSSDTDAEARRKGTYAVKRNALKITLTERGTLKTKNSTTINAETSAKIEWLIDEGKAVKKGEILVELEKNDVKQRVDNFKNTVIRLESELKGAETNLLIQETTNKTNVEKSQLAVEVADVTLKKLLEGDIPQEERRLKLAIEKAESDVRRYIERVSAYRELIKDEFATQDQLEQEELSLKKARTDLETATLDQKLYLKYKKPIDIKQKKAGLVEAERGAERAVIQAEAHLSAKQAAVRQKKVTLDATRKQLEKQEKILAKMTLKAPTDGTVLYGDPDNPWQRDNIKVGKQVWNNMTLITLPDPKEMAVLIYVHEADIDKVKKGMKCFITSETRKDRTYEGEITKVDAVANAGRGWNRDGAKKFKVEVGLEGENLNLKTGTSAEVEIMIDELPDVLSVPLQTIHAEEGKYYCFRRVNGEFETVEVKLGQDNGRHVEITDGLKEGDRVLLHAPDAGEEGAGEGSGATELSTGESR